MLGFIRFVLIAVMLLAGASYAIAQPRVATVIGNGDYVKPGWRLKNPVNDAHLMADTLRSIGYEVKVYENLDENEMEAAFQDHGNRLAAKGPDTIGIFYFAGHGVQSGKYNYLMPVDARPSTEQDVWAQAPRLGLATEFMESAGNAVNFIILDACRDNPLPRARRTGAGGGLGQPKRARGFVFAYATEPGRTAADGAGSNSPFTEALATILPAQGLSYLDVLSLVTDRVDDATNGGQTPYFSNGVIGGTGVCLNPTGCGGGVQSVTTPAPVEGGASVARSTESGAPAPTISRTSAVSDAGSTTKSEVRPGMNEESKTIALECDSGNQTKCGVLGVRYERGLGGVDQNYKEAVRLYQKGCREGGAALICSLLGHMYAAGREGIPKDLIEAERWFFQACNDAEADGCLHLGRVYQGNYEGSYSRAPNYAKAIHFYKKACEGDEFLGCFELGIMYAEKSGVERDYEEAMRLFGKACGEDIGHSCNYLGYMHQIGRGVSKDYGEAVRLFRKGCNEIEHPNSCRNLGYMYEHGQGVPRDNAEAVRLYRQACDGNFALSCYDSGRMYQEGLGVRQDHDEAARLYRKACDGGEANGCKNLKRLTGE